MRAALLAVALAACSPAAVCHSDWPDDPSTPEARQDACQRAATRLDALHCRESRPDFAAFCRHTIDAGIPLHPQCLASVPTCAAVEACR